jgi:DNA-binding transcriptional LysR family regulator
MNFRQIEAFRAVVQTGTVTAAGEMLHISQPAVSRLLTDLEYRVGFVLFDRIRGRLRLTPEGRAFYREVERAFVGLGQIESAAREIAAHSTGKLRILAMPILSGGILPSVLAQMALAHSSLSIQLDTARAGSIAEQVASGGYDVGFATDPVHDAAAVEVQSLTSRRLLCAFRPEHPLAAREAVRLEELEALPLVLFSRGTKLRSQLDQAFAAQGLRLEGRIAATTVESVCRFVEEGCGSAVIHPLTHHIARRHGLAVTPLDADLSAEVVAITQVHSRPTRLTAELIARMAGIMEAAP